MSIYTSVFVLYGVLSSSFGYSAIQVGHTNASKRADLALGLQLRHHWSIGCQGGSAAMALISQSSDRDVNSRSVTGENYSICQFLYPPTPCLFGVFLG